MAYCVNHPTTETDHTCAQCGRPFCDACLVEILGQRYCGPCRDRRLAEMQGQLTPPQTTAPPFAGTGTVDIGRWLTAGWQLIQGDILVFAVASLLYMLIGGLTCGILAGPMTCGMYLMVFRKMAYGRVEIGNVFDGFRRAGWAILGFFLLVAISFGVGIVLGLPGTAVQTIGQVQKNTGLTIVGALLNQIVSLAGGLVVGGALLFMFPHIAARNSNPIEALSASFQVFRRNWLMFVLTALLFQLIESAGVLALCVGIFVTVPLVMAATAQAYADHFGIEGFDAI
jgi:hypothetical protein